MFENPYLKGVLGSIGSAVCFSLMAYLIRLGEGISFFTSSFYRFAVGLCLIVSLALFKKIRIDFSNTPILFLRGLLGSFAVLLFYMSIVKLGIAKGTAISYTYPVFAALGGAVFLKERIRPLLWPLLLCSVIGMILLSGMFDTGNVSEGNRIWVVLALFGSVLGGLAIVCVKELTKSDSSHGIFMAQCLVGFWIVAVPANTTSLSLGWIGGVLLIAIGLTATSAQLLMTWSFKHVTIVTGSLLGLLTPIFNVLLGLIVFNETMNTVELLGTALVMLSCIGVVALGRIPLPARR